MECLSAAKDQLVVVGGTAHRLFPLHEFGSKPEFELLSTEDVDIAAPLKLQYLESRELLDQLERAGFIEEVKGAEYPSYIYRSGDNSGAYLQFIAPLQGSGIRRDGTKDRILNISGIQAEKLRYVDILLNEPWTVAVSIGTDTHEVKVVNPVAYVAQKLLVLPDRGEKRSKDLLYLFDTLSIFAMSLECFETEVEELASELPKKAKARIRRTADELCFAESNTSIGAARIAIEQRIHPPGSNQIVAACRLGLPRLLGPILNS